VVGSSTVRKVTITIASVPTVAMMRIPSISTIAIGSSVTIIRIIKRMRNRWMIIT